MTGIVMGAFGAHLLKERLSSEKLSILEIGIRYQIYHALALFVVAWAISRWPYQSTISVGWLFIMGVLLFSGSLYLIVLTGQRWLGAITPIGGLAMILGWAILAWVAFRG
tara:strand:- start:790 stop:1119 length:330 start_codon:yes stop_codon:yes gene_type:complete